MSMRIKSYFADSVQEALERARQELGPEAMLLNSKKTESELRNLGEFEVVLGVSRGSERESKPDSKQSIRTADASPVLVQEIAELRKQIETIKHSVTSQRRGMALTGEKRLMPGMEELPARLLAAGFSTDLVQEIVEGVELRMYVEARDAVREVRAIDQRSPSPSMEAALIEEMEARFRVAPPDSGFSESSARVLVFTGPAGAGKTTTLMKLALRWGVEQKLPVQILSADSLRVGGCEQLAAYARIAGLPFERLDTIAALDSALEEYRQKKAILIDTPGFGAAEMDEATELANFITGCKRTEVHLVLPATVQPDAGCKIGQRYRIFHPSKLVLTHTDEIGKPGPVLELAMLLGLPLSYLTDGQQIPEDLHPASKAALTESLRQPVRMAAVSAA